MEKLIGKIKVIIGVLALMVLFGAGQGVSASTLANDTVLTTALQSDGKIIIGGEFSSYNGIERGGIARLNADSSLDESFDPGVGANGDLEKLLVQSDGKIIIGGDFTTYDGTGRNRIARLNTDGTLDESFNPGDSIGSAWSDSIAALAIQSDGKIIIGGIFTAYNGTGRNRIARLNTDGTLDASFNPGTGADRVVWTIAIQSDGKIVIGGDFWKYNNISVAGVVLINSNGSYNSNFSLTGNSTIKSISIQADGKIVIGGWIRPSIYYGYGMTYGIARLLPGGSIDSEFLPGSGTSTNGNAYDAFVGDIAIRTDGKIFIAGHFLEYDLRNRNHIAQLNSNGSLDVTFPIIHSPLVTTDSVADITSVSASFGGVISDDDTIGENPQRLIEWGVVSGEYADSCLAGSGEPGIYYCNTYDLSPDTAYYFRAKAFNYAGTSYGSEMTFRTPILTVPTIITNAITNITPSSATGNGDVTDFGGEYSDRYIDWGTESGNYTYSCGAGSAGSGVFYCDMSGLSSNTVYYARARAVNSAGTAYGSEVTFQTPEPLAVTTGAAINVASTMATLGGNIISTGGEDNPERMIEVAASSGEYYGDYECTAGYGGVGGYFCDVTGLEPDTTYYYRAKASIPSSGGGGGVVKVDDSDFSDFFYYTANAGTVIGGGTTDAYGEEMTFHTVPPDLNGDVNSTVIQSDGKVLIGGNFTSYKGVNRSGIARLNPDDSLDMSFDSGLDSNEYPNVSAIALQSDGKIIIGGWFTTYDGTLMNSIVRLNVDGSPDMEFNSGLSDQDYQNIYAIAIQPDGKIIIGGDFTGYDGEPRNNIARLNSDGSLDVSFNPDLYPGVYSIIVQPDGKIIVGGYFIVDDGVSRNSIARLNIDGSVDASFNPSSGMDGAVNTMAIRPDGKIIIGGNFTSYDDVIVNGIALLSANGNLDASFNSGFYAEDYPGVNSVIIQSDGKIIIGGYFTGYDGESRNNIARLNSNGSLDMNFDVGTGTNDRVHAIAIQSDNRAVIGGAFTIYDGVEKNHFARLNADGSLYGASIVVTVPSTSTDPVTLITPTSATGNGNIIDIGNENPARLIEWGTVSGEYTKSCSAGAGGVGTFSCNMTGLAPNTDYYYRAKTTNSAGTAYGDEMIFKTILSTDLVNGNILTTALQPDGKVIIGGEFTFYDNISSNYIARLNTDGTLDNTFDSGAGASYSVYSIAIQSDGKIIIGGYFTSYDGVAVDGIARLNADGSLDNTFNGTGGVVNSISIQSDARIVLGTVNNGVIRLNSDGSLDTTFNQPAVGYRPNDVLATAIQPDGKIIIGGWYHSVVRLNVDGSLDDSFQSGITSNLYFIRKIAIQSDGKIIVGGYFSEYMGTTINSIIRLNANGHIDNTFNSGLGGNSDYITSILIQSDGKIIVGGYFSEYGSEARSNIAGLNSDGSLDAMSNFSAGQFSRIDSILYVQSGSKMIVSGGPSTYMSRVNLDGSLDTTFGQESTASPTLTTLIPPTAIKSTTATGRGNLSDTGGENPQRLIEWGTASGTYTNSCTAGIGSVGNYSCQLTDLLPDTTYYLRATATNSAGSSHGQETTLHTLPTQITIIDPTPTKINAALSSNYVEISSGTSDATPKTTTNVGITFQTSMASLTLPVNTEITNKDSGNFSMQNFVTTDQTAIVKQTFLNTIAAVKVGVTNTKLSFSQSGIISINVDSYYNNASMFVFYQEDGETDWISQTTCVISNGKCSFTTNHATTYVVKADGSMVGQTGINLNTDIQEVIALDCGSTTINLGNITPGTPITGSSTCTATTNANGGYNLSVRRDDATSTLKKNTENSITISDLTPWDPTTPNSNTWSGTGLGFTVYNSTANKNSAWWGTGTTLTDSNNRYAGFNVAQTDIMRNSTYSENSTATDIGYMLNVPPTQKSGAYSGSVTYQATTTP